MWKIQHLLAGAKSEFSQDVKDKMQKEETLRKATKELDHEFVKVIQPDAVARVKTLNPAINKYDTVSRVLETVALACEGSPELAKDIKGASTAFRKIADLERIFIEKFEKSIQPTLRKLIHRDFAKYKTLKKQVSKSRFEKDHLESEYAKSGIVTEQLTKARTRFHEDLAAFDACLDRQGKIHTSLHSFVHDSMKALHTYHWQLATDLTNCLDDFRPPTTPTNNVTTSPLGQDQWEEASTYDQSDSSTKKESDSDTSRKKDKSDVSRKKDRHAKKDGPKTSPKKEGSDGTIR